jgi:hypothetical protein
VLNARWCQGESTPLQEDAPIIFLIRNLTTGVRMPEEKSARFRFYTDKPVVALFAIESDIGIFV